MLSIVTLSMLAAHPKANFVGSTLSIIILVVVVLTILLVIGVIVSIAIHRIRLRQPMDFFTAWDSHF